MSFARIATSLARGAGHVERALSVGSAVLREGAHGVLANALDRAERQQLGIALYESRLDSVRCELMGWERAWLAADLPPAPARVLVGGAGAGREARALEAMGYSVGALEPGLDAARRCRASLSARALVAVGTYERLAAVVLDGANDLEVDVLASAEWDAILLGWTSMMHVLDAHDRRRLFATMTQLTPTGPILGTFYPASRAREPGRYHRQAARVGRVIGHLRGVTDASRDESFGLACGFLRGWTHHEIEARARESGRHVTFHDTDDACTRFTMTL